MPAIFETLRKLHAVSLGRLGRQPGQIFWIYMEGGGEEEEEEGEEEEEEEFIWNITRARALIYLVDLACWMRSWDLSIGMLRLF